MHALSPTAGRQLGDVGGVERVQRVLRRGREAAGAGVRRPAPLERRTVLPRLRHPRGLLQPGHVPREW